MFIALQYIERHVSGRRMGLLNTKEKRSPSPHFNNEKDAEIALGKAPTAQMPVNCAALFLLHILTSQLS